MFAAHHLTIPYACVFVTFMYWILSLIPLRYFASREEGGYDNKLPRIQQSGGKDVRLQRCLGIHQNTLEAFIFFSMAVVSNSLSFGYPTGVKVLSIMFVVARGLYPFFYFFDMDILRTLSWTVGLLATFLLYVLAFAF